VKEADELAILRPRVSELEHALTLERKHHRETQDRLLEAHDHIAAEKAVIHDLHKVISILRDFPRNDETPPLGNTPIQTDPIVRKNRDHG
jgi:hypothetical protein